MFVHLQDCFVDVFWIDKINEGILTLHDYLSDPTILLKSLSKVICDDASTYTSNVNLGGLCDGSVFSSLSGLTSTSVSVMVASAVVIGGASTS
jgi:hypothetical protein